MREGHLIGYGCTFYKARIPRWCLIHVERSVQKFCQSARWTPEQVSKSIGDTIMAVQEHYTTPNSDMLAGVQDKPMPRVQHVEQSRQVCRMLWFRDYKDSGTKVSAIIVPR